MHQPKAPRPAPPPDPPSAQPPANGNKAEEPAKQKKQKKPRISKAERKRLKLLAALAHKKKIIFDYLQREMLMTDKSVKRGKIQWEEMCKGIAEKGLREEIELWKEKTDFLIEKKDEKIDRLLRTLEETYEMQKRSFCKHMDQLDFLANCHKVLRDSATEMFNVEATDMVTDFFMEWEYLHGSREKAKLHYENIIHTTNVVAQERLRKNYEQYMDKKFNNVCSEIEKRYAMRDATIDKMQHLQTTLLDFIKALQGDLLDVHKSQKFLYFMQRQRNYVIESRKLNDLEKNTTRTMMDLEHELLQIESDANKAIYGLKLQQAYFYSGRSIIKSAIDKNKALTHEKLKVEANESYEVLKKLQEFVKRGELLLSLAACCSKYETQNEKVLPWKINPEDCVTDPDYILQLKTDIKKHLDISEDDLVEQMTFMTNFWFRCAHVKFHNILLAEEKRKLTEENEGYRNVIRLMRKSDDPESILEAMGVQSLQPKKKI